MKVVKGNQWQEVRRLANSFLRGEIEPLEAALALNAYGKDDHPKAADEPFLTVEMIASETDAIPLGNRRSFWHPDVRTDEDKKHDNAQIWARPMMETACHQLLAALQSVA